MWVHMKIPIEAQIIERGKGGGGERDQIPVINYSLQIIHPALVNTLLCFFTDRRGCGLDFP